MDHRKEKDFSIGEIEVFNDWSEDEKGPIFECYSKTKIIQERIIEI
jgi:hypothetical protein